MSETVHHETMVAALLFLRAAPGRSDELAELVLRMVDLTNRRHEPVFYGASRSAGDEELFVISELWATQADVDRHLASPEYQALNAEARERSLLVEADDSVELERLGDSPIRGIRLNPVTR